MSESIEFLKDIKKINREKSSIRRNNNQVNSTWMLKQAGIEFESKNGGSHLIVSSNRFIADFWPSTGKFIIRGDNRKFRGVRILMKIMNGKYTEQQFNSLRVSYDLHNKR